MRRLFSTCRCSFRPKMPTTFVDRLVCLCVGAMLFQLIAWPVLANQWGQFDGRTAALQDLSAGCLRMRIGGRQSIQARRRDEFIQRRYGIEVFPSGCVATDYGSGFNCGYNHAVDGELARRSLPKLDSIFDEACDAAR